LILANNSFDLSGVSNPTGQFGGSDPFAILVRNSSALSGDLALTFTGVNSFTGGLPIKNLTTATATLAGTFQFKTQADPTAAGVSAFNLVVGGTGSDRNLKGTGSSDWISLDAGDDRIGAGFGFDSLLGGIGNVPGAMVGGIVLGLSEELVAGYLSSNLRDAFAFALLIGVLLFKPTGLFGSRAVEKV
jgi:hypothetical protein